MQPTAPLLILALLIAGTALGAAGEAAPARPRARSGQGVRQGLRQ